jgi:putative CocE/NonD family hydrolase
MVNDSMAEVVKRMSEGPLGAYMKLSDLSVMLAKWNMAHLKVGEIDIGDARYHGLDQGYSKLFLTWFDYWLKGEQTALEKLPKVQLFVMGKGWISDDQWPLKSIHFTNYYLAAGSSHRGGRGLLSMAASRDSGKESYFYDPGAPTPSLVNDYPSPAPDLRPLEARADVLVYSTSQLNKPVTIAGPIEVVLYVSSSAKDTDFMVKLTDVYPDGKSIKLTDDAFRVRYRKGFDKKVLMQPGQVYEISLTNMATAIRFEKGHQIRLDISSSSFPWYERNLNTGGDNYDESTWVVAENSIHHGSRYPSHIVLPVLPNE